MSNVTQIGIPSLRLQLTQIIERIEMLADEPGALQGWGKEFGADLEDQAERLADLSAQIAVAHRDDSSRLGSPQMSLSASKHALSQ